MTSLSDESMKRSTDKLVRHSQETQIEIDHGQQNIFNLVTIKVSAATYQ